VALGGRECSIKGHYPPESDSKNPGRGAAGIMVERDSAVKRVLLAGPGRKAAKTGGLPPGPGRF